MKHSKSKLLYYTVSPISVVFSTVFAMSLQPVIDSGLTGNMRSFAKAAVFSVIFCFLDVLFSYIVDYVELSVTTQTVEKLRLHFFELIFQKRIDLFEEKNSSEYLTSLTACSEEIVEKATQNGLKIYKSIWSLLISVIAIGTAGWEIAVYVLIFSLISVYLPKIFQQHSIAAEQEFLKANDQHMNVVQESIHNYVVLRMFRIVGRQRERYAECIHTLAKKEKSRTNKTYIVNTIAAGISELSFVLIIIFSMILVIQGKLTVGYIMSVSQLLGGIMFPFEMLPGYIMERKSGKEIAQKTESDLSSDSVSTTQKYELSVSPQRILADHVSFSYRNDAPVLKDINLTFDLNKKYAIVGESGSGKSTLAKLLVGFLNPNTGAVSMEHKNVADIFEKDLFQYVTYQNQRTTLFNDTVKNNITLGKPLSAAEWNHIVDVACIKRFIENLPQREHTMVEENGKNISGGEGQRIAFARMLASKPKFAVFDESLSALDNQTAKSIEYSMLTQKDMGLAMITHRIFEDNMKLYDEIIVIKEGKVIEQNSWNNLSCKEHLLALGSLSKSSECVGYTQKNF